MQQNGGKRSLFKEKVIVCRESIQEAKNADCYINFCSSNILSGNSQHAMLHQIAGPELASECYKFFGTCPTSSRVTSAFDARNFTFIVHTIVPTPLDLGRLIDVKKVYICIRNSLDLAIEEGAKTIAFPSQFPGLSNRITSEIVLRIFTVWIHRNIYSEQLKELKICCENEEDFNMFVQSARSLYEEANVIGNLFVPAFIQQRHAYYQRMSRPRRYRRLYEPAPENAPQVKLELSAKLAPTILVIDDENGMKRQYRLTNKSRDGRKLYFRCSRCDTLIKKDGVQIRAKLIVEDGQIVSERFPRHHPECEGKPLEKVLIQQVDRTSRREVRDGYLLPQDAYKKALDRMRFEARQLGIPVEECFPEWPKLRQQYCRIRKQAIRQRQQEKWEIMMMGKGYLDESQFDFDDYYYQQIQQPRRGRPPKVKSEPLFLPRMRYSPTHDGVVISYDDEEDEFYGGEEMAQSSTSGRKRNHVHLSQQEVEPKISEMNVEDQEEEVTIDDRMLLVEQQEQATFEEIEVDME